MTQTNNTTQNFAALMEEIKMEKCSQFNDFVRELNEAQTIEEILKSWRLTEPMTAAKKKAKWLSIEELKAYILKRRTQNLQKSIEQKETRLNTIANAGELVSIKISVEWKRSRTWGSNPTATVRVTKAGGYSDTYVGSASGCGYDKESAAIAKALNQSNELLKLLYLAKEAQPLCNNHELFGYGSGYGILPSIEGGVGVSCYPRIFEKLGFKWSSTGSGKSFDCYTVQKAS
jgi:hypothetical protein